MNNSTLKDVHHQLESLLRAHLDTQREALLAVVERVYGAPSQPASRGSAARRSSPAAASRTAPVGRARRPEAEIAALAERLCAAVAAEPGVGMTRLAAQLGVVSRELERPMTHLKLDRRVRSVGRYQSTRYFPLST